MRLVPLLWCCAVLGLAADARAWSPFRMENPNAKKGNELMAKARYADALRAYDEAARELPDAREVQLNRGLALLSQDRTEESKEAFLAAASPSAPPGTRADAYYDLGLAYAREGDALSEQEDFQGASDRFREAVDAFKRALRARPGDRNAAWNLEHALNRIREEEQRHQEQQEEQQGEEGQEPEPQQDQEPQDQEPPNPSEQDEPSEGSNEEPGQEQEEPSSPEAQQGEGDDAEPQSDPERSSGDEDGAPQEREEATGAGDSERQKSPMPPGEVDRFLDALEQSEESLPLQRARRRNARRRPPEKDW